MNKEKTVCSYCGEPFLAEHHMEGDVYIQIPLTCGKKECKDKLKKDIQYSKNVWDRCSSCGIKLTNKNRGLSFTINYKEKRAEYECLKCEEKSSKKIAQHIKQQKVSFPTAKAKCVDCGRDVEVASWAIGCKIHCGCKIE